MPTIKTMSKLKKMLLRWETKKSYTAAERKPARSNMEGGCKE